MDLQIFLFSPGIAVYLGKS